MPDPNNPENMREIDPEKFLEEKGGKDAFFESMQPDDNFPGGFKIGKQSLDNERLQALSDRVEILENLIKSIFDGHVLIDGQFRRITP